MCNLNQDSWEPFLWRVTETHTSEPCPGINFRAREVCLADRERWILVRGSEKLQWSFHEKGNALGGERKMAILKRVY